MNYIKGNFRSIIYEGNNGYKVGLFKVKETNDEEMQDFLNKVVTFTGFFNDLNKEDKYLFYGSLNNHERYGYQYAVKNYEKVIPEGKEAIIEFLASPLIKNCGEKTATNIVNTLGEEAINKIKEGYQNLLVVPGITENRALKIYNSVMKYAAVDDMMIKLKEYGFSTPEVTNIISIYNDKALNIVNENIYLLKELIGFDKLDNIFIKFNDPADSIRIKSCILEVMNRLTFINGDTYHYVQEIVSGLKTMFKIMVEEDNFNYLIAELVKNKEIVIEADKYYLRESFDMENYIANSLLVTASGKATNYKKVDELIKQIEKEEGINFDKTQIEAIKAALNNNITIITGGPGTGKTTIVKTILKIFKALNNYSEGESIYNIALLAPTGRASKKLMEVTNHSAMTIHRFLKWHKESNTFEYNEENKLHKELVIVDEVSMIDTFLFDSLMRGINHDLKLILIGDENQLPSVGSGLILNDLISTNKFKHIALSKIFRQKSESSIPYLAKEIKDKKLSKDYFLLKEDFNFIETSPNKIKSNIETIALKALEKGITEKDLIVLAPMYKGENGIDNLNNLLQELYNKKAPTKEEIHIADVIFREGDKVIQLTNDVDHNVFNGDIGYIAEINSKAKEVLIVNFDGNFVPYKKEDLIHLKHAYAISIHKSQGSEFDYVLLPITPSFSKMLYNKLIYTGVSRAKKSLIIIGDKLSFERGVQNNYSINRKTTLKERIMASNG